MAKSSRFALLFAIGWAWAASSGDAQTVAKDVIDRRGLLSGILPRLDPASLNKDDLARAEKWVSGGTVWRLEERPVDPRLDGRLGTAAQSFTPMIDERQYLAVLPALAVAKYDYLRILHGMARDQGFSPGPLHRGAAAHLVSILWYSTELAWSSEGKEELALYYVVDAALQSKPGRRLSLTPNQADVVECLNALHGSASPDLQNLILNGPQGADNGRGFELVDVLSPGYDPERAFEPPANAVAAPAKKLLALLQASPRNHPNLAARTRAERIAVTITAGWVPTWEARRQRGTEMAPVPNLAEKVRDLERVRSSWLSSLTEETARRRQSKSKSSLDVDGHVLAETTIALLATSPEYARLVRIPHAEANGPPADLNARLKKVFEADPLLSRLAALGFPAPTFQVAPKSANSQQKMLVVTWEHALTTVEDGRARTFKEPVTYRWTDAFSRGGAGLPVLPALAGKQTIQTRQTGGSEPAKSLMVNQISVGDTVPATPDLIVGKYPNGSVHWYPVVKLVPLKNPPAIRVRAGNVEITGTPTLHVYACRGAAAPNWTKLLDLRLGDSLVRPDGGRVSIGVIESNDVSSDTFVVIETGMTDHVHTQGALAQTKPFSVKAKSLHGIETGAELVIGHENARSTKTIQALLDANAVDLKTQRFVDAISVNSLAAQLRLRNDFLVSLARDQTQILYEIKYKLPSGDTRSICVAPSHGFLLANLGTSKKTVSLKQKKLTPNSEIEAQDVDEGMLLTCDEHGKTAVVVGPVTVRMTAASTEFPLAHPRVVRGQWVVANEIFVHAAERFSQIGVLEGTQVTLAMAEGAKCEVGVELSVEEIRRFAPQSDYDAILACWPGARSGAGKFGRFLPRGAEQVFWTLSADVIRLKTSSNRELYCAPRTRLYRREGPGSSTAGRFGRVEARHLSPGDHVLALQPNQSTPALAVERLVSVSPIDGFEQPNRKGFFKTVIVTSAESSVENVAALQSNYDSFFANGLLVHLPKPGDGDVDSAFAGGGAGNGPLGVSPGRKSGNAPGLPDESNPARSPAHLPSIKNPEDEASDPLVSFSPADDQAFKNSWRRLVAEKDKLVSNSLDGPENTQQFERWKRGASRLFDERDIGKAYSRKNFLKVFDRYRQNRETALATQSSNQLRDLAEAGMGLSYLCHELGGKAAAEACLNDLLTIQMRVTLRAGADDSLWKSGKLFRETLQFAMELTRMDDPSVADRVWRDRYWSVEWSATEWHDIVAARIAEKKMHGHVVSNGKVNLLHLMLQLDARAGIHDPWTGFLTRDFGLNSEFAGPISELWPK